MIDLLNMVYHNRINKEYAQIILDNTISDFHSGKLKIIIPSELMLDNYEWTAICQGVDLDILAKWKVEGWPRNCSLCGRELDYRKYGWLIQSNQLCHTACLNENIAQAEI